MLERLALHQVSPCEQLDITFAPRINMFTGDNGLGKSFVLDMAWAILAKSWIKLPPYPDPNSTNPSIQYKTDSGHGNYHFDVSQQSWAAMHDTPSKIVPELVIYVQSNGDLALWDATRTHIKQARIPAKQFVGHMYPSSRQFFSGSYHFTPDTLWNGLKVDNTVLCSGLLHDWIRWQFQPAQDPEQPFELFKRVLQHLSPHPEEQLIPGTPMRTSVEDVRDIPTLQLPYGLVPITHISAGMQRVIGLAYLLTWAWHEHVQAALLRQQAPSTSLILLIDEPEAHLHPQWQRRLFPALLDVVQALSPQLHIQLISTTHSPLILSSLEPLFSEQQDALWHFDLDGQNVTLHKESRYKYGDVNRWLTSPVFDLTSPRSLEGEALLNEVNQFLITGAGDTRQGQDLDQRLRAQLPQTDPFWMRWRYIGEKQGWLHDPHQPPA
jgi:hypothetical protein